MINYAYAETLFHFLYGDFNGYEISTKARATDNATNLELLYGELPLITCKEILERCDPKKDGIFFDLGSGTGRVAMAMHLLADFQKSIGVELLTGLHDKACEIKKKFEKTVKPQIEDHVAGRELLFTKGNILETDLSSADFVFLNHPFKKAADFLLLEEKFLKELKPKSKIVTIIRRLQNSAFKDLGSQKYKFSWGDSTAYFFEV